MKFIEGRLKEKPQEKKNEDLLSVKERALDELRYCNVKLKRIKNGDARVQNNRMFQEDQGAFL